MQDDDIEQNLEERPEQGASEQSVLGGRDDLVVESLKAVVLGEVISDWPKDLFIPPDALEVVLESFEGPLDLLLYLIRKQNLDILNIPVADITKQYMAYVEIMRAANLDLAAEYLVMAALLGEIKSRMLLPRPKSEEDDDEDPRAALVRRLQEYERFSKAAGQLDDRPRLERDVYTAQADLIDPDPPQVLAQVKLTQLVDAFQKVVERAEANRHMFISRDMLSMRERMTNVLSKLNETGFLRFEELFTPEEGRLGVVVTFIALLELCRDDMLLIVQTEPFAPIHIKRAA
ncbi:MAG: segregation/condensation protein A [Arenicella sp.]|nr:segregation/condensation protein A [Arenicella sp.]